MVSKTPSLALIDLALARYEEARRERHVYVSRVAGRFSRGRGRGVEAGRRVHGRLWALDPYDILEYGEVCTPFPLAWRFRFGWLLGVPDRLCFKHGIPYAIVEYKSYSKIGKAEVIQASLYGLLAQLNFSVKPTVLLKLDDRLEEIRDWEFHALEGLEKARKPPR